MGWITATAVCLIAVVASLLVVSQQSKSGPACVNDAPLQVPGIIKEDVDPCFCFTEGYHEARSKFIEAAQAAGAEMHSLPIVGDDYTTDICIVKGTMPGYVIHTSGLHGVEGYTGSPVQIAWLKHVAPSYKVGPTVVLVHAVNPYGMAHFRRWNEANVDLNRNAMHPDEWPNALTRDANVASYQDFDTTLFNPRRAPTTYDWLIGMWLWAVYTVKTYGLENMKRAMVTGQYHFKEGVFFGGQELQPSHAKLQQFVESQLIPNMESDATVTWIDVHSGLGKSGVDTLMVDGVMKESEIRYWFPNKSVQGFSDAKEDEEAGGYNLAIGVMNTFYQSLFDSSHNAWVVSQEFGTIPSVMVARALILENMAHQYLPSEEAQAWAGMTRDAFYPSDAAWRKSVLTRGLELLSQAIVRSSNSNVEK